MEHILTAVLERMRKYILYVISLSLVVVIKTEENEFRDAEQ